MEKIKLTKEEEEQKTLEIIKRNMDKKETLKTTFKELTLPVRIAIIGAWVYIILNIVLFIYGFYLGVMGGI